MWLAKNNTDIIAELNTNLQQGLTNEEAKLRIEKYGYNKLKEKKKKSLLYMIFQQINDVLIYVLIAAAIISALLGEIPDAIIIGLVIVLNAVVGVIQESKAEKSLEALKKLSTPKAIVKRSGKLTEVPSEEVVPGDIIMLDAGRYIPCDIRIVESANLKIEESALTGESVPVDKISDPIITDEQIPLGDQKNMAFMSTLVTYGRGIGVAVSTGMNTEIGKIAQMLNEDVDTQTPLQKKLAQVGKTLGFLAIAVCAIMFVVGILQGRDYVEMFMTSISLAVAAIPEGLPAVVTIVLAIGVQKMIKQNAIIRKLPAVETLGSVSIICSDKTGTLTQNKMTVVKYYTNNKLKDISKLDLNNKVDKILLENLVLNNDASYSKEQSTGDPTEIALVEAGFTFNILKDDLENEHKRVDEVPFDSDRKLMSTVNTYGDNIYVMTKGAIDNLIKLCDYILIDNEVIEFTSSIKENIINVANSMSENALRVLASAYKICDYDILKKEPIESNLTFIGMVGMIDPPREEVKDSINVCKNSGIETVMITGDHKITALAIAKDLGIASDERQAISGNELDNLSQDELNEKVKTLRVFARVSPEHKVKIVKAFKSHGDIVSMTGDGVNDAPSLRIADIGVAMGITGTDVAKNASDMVLTDDNFSTIVNAVEQGRNIYNNIKKTISFLLSCNIGEIFALFISILLGWATPLKPIHILWVNLVTDTFPALSLGADSDDPDIMKNKPRDPNESLFKGTGLFILINGAIIGFATLAAFIIGIKMFTNNSGLFPLFPSNCPDDALRHGQTMAFLVLSISQLVHSFNLRNSTKSIFTVGIFSNKYLVGSFILGLLLQISIVSIPFLANVFGVYVLSLKDWSIVALLSLIPLFINELIKIFKRAKK